MTYGLGNVLHGTAGIRTYTYSVEVREEQREEKRVLIETEEINR